MDSQDLKSEPNAVYVHLFHGREDPDEHMDDWGEEGPLLGPFRHVNMTYASELKCFTLEDATLAVIPIIEDLVAYDGMYYGDVSILDGGWIEENNPSLFEWLEPIDETLAKTDDTPGSKQRPVKADAVDCPVCDGHTKHLDCHRCQGDGIIETDPGQLKQTLEEIKRFEYVGELSKKRAKKTALYYLGKYPGLTGADHETEIKGLVTDIIAAAVNEAEENMLKRFIDLGIITDSND